MPQGLTRRNMLTRAGKRPVNDRNAVRLQIGMMSGFTPEPRPASSRKTVRIASESTLSWQTSFNRMPE